MAQGQFFDDDDFGTETALEIDKQDFESFMEGTPAPKRADTPIKPVTDEDKRIAAERGKAETDEEKSEKIRIAKKKEADDARTFIEGNEESEEDKGEEGKEGKPVDPKRETESDVGLDFEELTKDLFNSGIFTKDEGEESEIELPSTPEEFIDRFNWEKQKVAEQMVYNFAGRHGEEHRELFDAIFVKGVSPKDYVPKYLEVQNFKDMDLTDESNQAAIIETSLKNQGWEPEDIKEEIKRLRLSADLEGVATRTHKGLVKTEEEKLAQVAVESKNRLERKKQLDTQYAQSIRTTLSEAVKKSEIDGIPVNRESADKVIKFIEAKTGVLPTGELITDFDRLFMELQNPINHAAKVKLGLLMMKGYKPGEPITIDLVPVAKTAVSKESNETFKWIKGKKAKTTDTEVSRSGFLDGL